MLTLQRRERETQKETLRNAFRHPWLFLWSIALQQTLWALESEKEEKHTKRSNLILVKTKNFFFFKLKETYSPWVGDSNNYCSHGRVNSVGAGLSARLNTVLEEIYVWGGGGEGKGASVHFKIQNVDLLQRGLFKVKEAKLSWPLAWNHLNSETLLQRTCAWSHFPLLHPEVWCKSSCAY
uniref:Uncharacterized protein n=1 Tax=Myotis myotis TaxID=51298 RepID=A0A7J7WHK2_MYOMY|nr:hypothetical protein mMyoMyo1_012061 [Myotis myotis]